MSRGNELPHLPVLYHEIIHALRPIRGELYIDGTVGAGGHAAGILEASAPDGKLLGLDVDPQALTIAADHLGQFGERAILIQASYVTLLEQIQRLGWWGIHGILLDFGVSSMQLDTGERGFSFSADAPLDMRFDPHNPVTAAHLVNRLPERDLADLLFKYGEETQARRIARAIVAARPIHRTAQLAEIVRQAAGNRRPRQKGSGSQHPATLTFQALRIAVNQELEAVEAVLPKAVEALLPGGRLAVISFHSLEDRIVKQFMRRESRDCLCPPRQPVCTCGHKATLLEVTRQPVRPSQAEIDRNPRSRSARLRIAEKLPASVVSSP